MDHFTYHSGEAHCEKVPLATIARKVGTPAYVYSRTTILEHCLRLKAAFESHPTLPCFAVKANGNLKVLKEIFGNGFGADVVSGGEMERALLGGVKSHQIVFSGVGKTPAEIDRAIEVGILSFNVESEYEIDLIAARARERKRDKPVDICLRVNPNIDAKTNPYIATGLYSSKFGITEPEIPPLLERIRALPELNLIGIGCHIGSQILELGPFREAAARMAALAREVQAKGFELRFIDMGGGLGIRYKEESPPPWRSTPPPFWNPSPPRACHW